MTRRFTPAEADRTLPLVRRIVADVLVRGRALRAARRRNRDERRDAERELRALLRELEELGCRYEDLGFEVGRVDFPARLAGRDVYLCWRSDEPRVTHYHDRGESYERRRPLPPEELERS